MLAVRRGNFLALRTLASLCHATKPYQVHGLPRLSTPVSMVMDFYAPIFRAFRAGAALSDTTSLENRRIH